MKLTEYILKKIIPLFIGATLFFALILNLVDLFINLTSYLQNGCSALNISKVIVYYIPKTIWYAVPVAILFSTSYTLSDMYAHNELEALFACGVSLFKFTFPVIFLSMLMSLGLFLFENFCVVPTYEKKITLQNSLLNKSEKENNTNVIVISDNGKIVYKAVRYFDESRRLQELYLVFRDDNKKLEHVVYAAFAFWNEELKHWLLQSPIQFDVKEDGSFGKVSYDKELEKRLTEPYTIFRRKLVDIQSVSAKDAKIYINHLRKAGLPYFQQQSEYYKKFAFPFIVFIVVFLSIGLTGKTKKNVLLISLASSIGASVLFYVILMLTMVFAKHGYISPFSGAWSPVIMFTIASIVLLKYSRT